MSMPVYLTIAGFAARMSMHYDTVRARIREGMPVEYIGERQPRVPIVEAVEWLKRRAERLRALKAGRMPAESGLVQ